MWPFFERLLERWVGVASFRTFVIHGLVPVNPNDYYYYSDRCAICWGHYDDEHRSIRLTGNHVFGGGCLYDLIAEAGMNLCPICRRVWYRDTSLSAVAWQCLVAICTWFLHPIIPVAVKIRDIWSMLRLRYPRSYLVLFMAS
jgi:hypothetical protein